MHSRYVRLIILILRFSGGLSPGATSAFDAPEEVLAPVTLRGFGEVSGKWQPLDHGSLLQVQCASEDKARLLQAKYLSDLQVLPGVEPLELAGSAETIPAFAMGGEAFLAARAGRQVFILTADSAAALEKLEKTAIPATGAEFKPGMDVPMYLDRWDKYGMRFYYAPLALPDGQTLNTYDKNTDFAWSEKNQTGIQVWDPLYEFDVAQGITTRNDIKWAIDAADAHHLPLGINLSTNNQLWLEDWFPFDMAQQAPQFLGSYYNGPMGIGDGSRFISWNSSTAEDMELGTLQQDVHFFNHLDNLTSWLEPHGEIGHGDTDFLMEYGPLADKTFREWLENKYRFPKMVSQRWTGQADAFSSWEDVHVPELASFCGWGPDAIDLQGSWKINFYPALETQGDQPIPYPTDTFSPAFDDNKWAEMTAPGDGHAIFLPKKPAVYRRTFTVDGRWLKAHPRSWLYEFDLNEANGKEIVATLNGKEVGRSKVTEGDAHRDWFEVTGAVKEGTNVLALALPQGYLSYRVYLSGVEPHPYPYLGPQLNARWEDFAEWAAWTRVEKVRRGMEMIRQVDPDRGLMMMTPGQFFGDEQKLAKEYGGEFHDTGGMQGWWNTFYPEMMNGIGMPVSVEAGGPDHDVKHLNQSLGRWSTEGIQGMDYFLQLGDIFWHPDLRADFEDNLKLWKLVGKYHVAPPQYASFYSGRDAALATFPWNISDPNQLLRMGFPLWGWYDGSYPGAAGITENEFFDGSANKYKVIIDSNSSILDQQTIDAITAYVKQGGIFVTYVQTGRHSTTVPNSWPIAQLTGYGVTGIDPYVPGNNLESKRPVAPAPNQTIFPAGTWSARAAVNGSGLSLKKAAPECTDLLVWGDGSIAAGMRPVGKGYVFDFGVKYDGVGWQDVLGVNQMFDAVLEFAKIPRDPVQLENPTLVTPVTGQEADIHWLHYRHFLSNNGLYDVFSLWNSSQQAVNADLVFHPGGSAPTTAIRVKTGETVSLGKTGGALPVLKIQIGPNETQSYLTQRLDLAAASRDWFDLQRQWWKGTRQPPAHTFPRAETIHKNTLLLNDDWACQSNPNSSTGTAWIAPAFDDSAWTKGSITGQLVPLPGPQKPPQTILYRRHFTVPANWNKGVMTFFMTPTESDAFYDSGQVYCDGKPIKISNRSLINQGFDPPLQPGSSHVLAVQIQSKSCVIGCMGSAWLYYRPNATEQMDLAGNWDTCSDGLRFDQKAVLPGAWDAQMARRMVTIPAAHSRQTVMLHIEASGPMVGAVINGRWISQSHVSNCPAFDLNITPWVKWGADNKIELVAYSKSQMTVPKLSLEFYDAGSYP